VEFRHYYSIRGWKARLFHWIAGRRIAKDAQATLNAMKRAIEAVAPRAIPTGDGSAKPYR